MAAPKIVHRRTWEDQETKVLLEKWGDKKRPAKIEVLY